MRVRSKVKVLPLLDIGQLYDLLTSEHIRWRIHRILNRHVSTLLLDAVGRVPGWCLDTLLAHHGLIEVATRVVGLLLKQFTIR